jgi:UDP-N-acetylmuramoyl-L-alanine---L-glutamate ligase
MLLEKLVRQRVAVLGYGREGQSAVAALLGVRADADVTVLVESGALPDHVPAVCGPFGDNLLEYDILLRSPGVNVSHPALQQFRRQGGTIVNPTSIWFSERPEVTVTGITGSKGKSTTASLLTHLLRGAGLRTLLAGNIGVPLLDHLNTNAGVVVAELSSFQLADLEGRLKLGVITRLFDEHLDWHGDQNSYFSSKLRLATLLDGNPLVINSADLVLRSATVAVPGRIEGNRVPGFNRQDDRVHLDQFPLISSHELSLVGRHNLDNAALAMEAAHLLGCELGSMLRSLRTFSPLPHRIERVATAHGRHWINDSIATTPHATRAALEALQGRSVTLIAGGQPRPADWMPVIEWCKKHDLTGLVVLPDNGAEVASALVEAGVIDAARVLSASDMAEAVHAAVALSGPGGTVLLSPGAPSFNHYRDFQDRGEQFRRAVADYRDRSTA